MMPKATTEDIDVKEVIRRRYLDAIEEIRTQTKESYTTIMENLGDHQQSLAILRRGVRFPTLANIFHLCSHYGYNADWILLGQGRRKAKSKTIEEQVLDLEQDLSNIKKKLKIK